MSGTGRIRRFGPLLASRISGKVFANRTGDVVTVDDRTCQPDEVGWLDEAVRWIKGGAS